MAKSGPPKFFDNKPKGPSKVPVPSSRTRRFTGIGGAKKAPRSMAGQSQAEGRLAKLLGGGESWKTYSVIVVSAIILAGLMYTYIARSFRAMDKSRAVAEMGLIAASLQAIDDELGGFRLADTQKNDAAILALLRDVAQGGDVARNDKGEIFGSGEAESGAPRRFVDRISDKSVAGSPFRFILPVPGGDSKSNLPTIEVVGVGKLHPPTDKAGPWIFEGDLTHVPRRAEAGGDYVPVSIPLGNGGYKELGIFKIRESKGETTEDSTESGS